MLFLTLRENFWAIHFSWTEQSIHPTHAVWMAQADFELDTGQCKNQVW